MEQFQIECGLFSCFLFDIHPFRYYLCGDYRSLPDFDPYHIGRCIECYPSSFIYYIHLA
jgi:hypothetical protein